MAAILYSSAINAIASNGGNGAFSFADTSIFGVRQFKTVWVEERVTFNPDTGAIASRIFVPSTYLIVPGGGGGAKAMGKKAFGSHATGFDPNGRVIIRVFKVGS